MLYLSEICITATAFLKPDNNYFGIQLRLVCSSIILLAVSVYCCTAGSRNSDLCLLSEICITATAFLKPNNYFGIKQVVCLE